MHESIECACFAQREWKSFSPRAWSNDFERDHTLHRRILTGAIHASVRTTPYFPIDAIRAMYRMRV
jgi:hypothetical protein